MKTRLVVRTVALWLGLAALAAPAAQAQCRPQLVPGPWTSIDGDVCDMTAFERGGVLAVCVVGAFTHIDGVEAGGAVWWRPETGEWGPMDTLAPGSGCCAPTFSAVCLFDDGSGETLFAASSRGVWKWAGGSWVSFGEAGRVCNDIAVIPMGGVPRLVIATKRWPLDGLVRVWNGAEWAPVGNDGSRISGTVSSVASGSIAAGQPELLAVGAIFINPGTTPSPVRSIVKWDGLNWSPIADETGVTPGFLRCDVRPFDDGSPIGNTIYYCGSQGGQGGGVWRVAEGAAGGGAWERVTGSSLGSYLFAFSPFNDGTRTRPRLYAGGWGLHAWDGVSWETISPVHFGLPVIPGVISGEVRSLSSYQPPAAARPMLLLGGSRLMNLDGHVGVAYLTSCAPCPADFDQSGTLGVQDLLSYLQAWFARDPAADFNATVGVDLSDLFSFLSAWQVGCL